MMDRARLIRWGKGGLAGACVAVGTSLGKEEDIPPPPPSPPQPNATKDAAEVGGAVVICGVAVPKLVTFAATGIGFTEAGVAAKSIAAAYQSTVGNVAAGSFFSSLQSISATGGFAVTGPIGIGAAVIAGGAVVYYKVQQKRAKEEEERLRREQEENKRLSNRISKFFWR